MRRLESWLEQALVVARQHRRLAALLVDVMAVVVAWQATYLFRLGFERWWSARPDYDTAVLLGVVAVYAASFWLFKVPRGLWRFAGFTDIKRLMAACGLAGLVNAVWVMGAQLVAIPRAVLALHPLAVWLIVVGLRVGYRTLHEYLRAQVRGAQPERRALVLGAGEAARRLLAGIHRQGWEVVGLLDDDVAKHDTHLAGIPVLGGLDMLQDPSALSGITHLIIAMPSVPAPKRRRIVELAGLARLPVLTVPSSDELNDGQVGIDRVRDIQPEDLLGREPVQLDEVGIETVLKGKTVLVTGGGGSIGSELCRQLARHHPARLVIVELSEYNLYRMDQELRERFPGLALVPLIGDVKDLDALRDIFQRERPQVVFHAAAYKHVPLMEVGNARAAVRNNTLGTFHAGQAAAECGAERFVLISTDKAVNPTNVMGATKRAAEMVVSSLAVEHPATRFMAVRFGNVLGSSGSVIPLFKEQIARGGPVTVTHPDIIRYFMTIPEAARLVIQAAAMGESGQVLVLEMGEPVRIVDLARTMIRLSGHSEQDIAIEFTGLRPGEKLFEELLADDDQTVPTAVPRLRIARLGQSSQSPLLLELLRSGELAAPGGAADSVQAWLARLIPEYQPAKQARH